MEVIFTERVLGCISSLNNIQEPRPLGFSFQEGVAPGFQQRTQLPRGTLHGATSVVKMRDPGEERSRRPQSHQTLTSPLF